MEKIYFAKVREVKSPTRGTSRSAGIDLYVPKFTEEFIKDLNEKNKNDNEDYKDLFYNNSYFINNSLKRIILFPGKRILIPSGIKIRGIKDHVLIAFNKSGVANKKGLDVLACVIDEDYQGEIHISLYNTSNDEPVFIYEDEKIVQLVLIKNMITDIEELPLKELFDKETERGEGGFGSTNKK